jgi:hypothetical protein
MGLGDSFNRMVGKTRFVVSRVFLHLAGTEVSPLLGTLNQAARQAVESDGDVTIVGECLAEICQQLLQYDVYWRSAGNEGDVFWNEGEAGDYVNELFTDSAGRYLSEPDAVGNVPQDTPLTLPATSNIVLMLSFAFEGEDTTIETDLTNMANMRIALKSIINHHYQDRLRAVQVHFSPARFSDVLTDDQVMLNFPELVPL